MWPHLPWLAGHALFSAFQDTTDLLGHTDGSWPTCCPTGQPEIHLHRASFQQFSPQPVLMHKVFPPQQGVGLSTCSCWPSSGSSLPNSGLSSSCPSSTAFRCISSSSQICVISKLAEGAFYPLIQITNEDVEQDQIQYQSPGNTTTYRCPTRLCTAEKKPSELCESASSPSTSLYTHLSSRS